MMIDRDRKEPDKKTRKQTRINKTRKIKTALRNNRLRGPSKRIAKRHIPFEAFLLSQQSRRLLLP
jgi:hypothetical protein